MNGPVLHLGHDHRLRFTSWRPDRVLNSQYQGLPDIEQGATIEHPHRNSTTICTSGIAFDGEIQRQVYGPDRPLRHVEAWHPLTLTPSLLCGACGDHAHITGGWWVPA